MKYIKITTFDKTFLMKKYKIFSKVFILGEGLLSEKHLSFDVPFQQKSCWPGVSTGQIDTCITELVPHQGWSGTCKNCVTSVSQNGGFWKKI